MHRPGVILLMLTTLSCLFTSGALHARASAPQLSVDNKTATAGFFRLNWESNADSFELQEATSADFRNTASTYSGPDLATVISGKPNGTWYYRVRAMTDGQHGPWSDVVTVTVAHHSLARALMFLALGFIVFAAIVLLILRARETQ